MGGGLLAEAAGRRGAVGRLEDIRDRPEAVPQRYRRAREDRRGAAQGARVQVILSFKSLRCGISYSIQSATIIGLGFIFMSLHSTSALRASDYDPAFVMGSPSNMVERDQMMGGQGQRRVKIEEEDKVFVAGQGEGKDDGRTLGTSHDHPQQRKDGLLSRKRCREAPPGSHKGIKGAVQTATQRLNARGDVKGVSGRGGFQGRGKRSNPALVRSGSKISKKGNSKKCSSNKVAAKVQGFSFLKHGILARLICLPHS